MPKKPNPIKVNIKSHFKRQPAFLGTLLRSARKKRYMKKFESDELRPEYQRADLGQGIRGKYFKSYKKGTNLVLLSPDVAKAFPSEDAVNDALRSLINLA